jgi:hypothetical protein
MGNQLEECSGNWVRMSTSPSELATMSGMPPRRGIGVLCRLRVSVA